MKFRKSWCAFFSSVGGLAVTGLVVTATISKSACDTVSNIVSDLINTLLTDNLGISGTLKMNVTVGDPDPDFAIPIEGKGLSLSLHLDLNEKLIKQLNELPDLAENTCQGILWDAGIKGVLLLLLTLAAVYGVTLVYKYTQKKEQAVAEDPTDLMMRLV
jgi:hypothetical protein